MHEALESGLCGAALWLDSDAFVADHTLRIDSLLSRPDIFFAAGGDAPPYRSAFCAGVRPKGSPSLPLNITRDHPPSL